ncbi:Detected protein of confused Function [Hibiscus syriacus]|uniref:Detected protein of confused Function n=1 Tax=Hibiscus syriacus TaxID=106335 RepID=A0A6A3AG41_HIBSY|nr:Detected protein of confused Function [Hibiscus syriacus]
MIGMAILEALHLCDIIIKEEQFQGQDTGREVAALAEGTGMIITETGIIGKEIVVGVMSYERDRYGGKDRGYQRLSRSRSASPDYSKGQGRGHSDDDRRSGSRSMSASPARRSPSPRKSLSPRKASSPRGESPDRRSRGRGSPSPRSVSPRGCPADSRSPSPRNSDVDE